MYTVVLNKSCAKYLESLPLKSAEAIIDKIEDLKRDPYGNSIFLHGQLKSLRRAKVKKFRIIFKLSETAKQIHIEAIGSRGDIYK